MEKWNSHISQPKAVNGGGPQGGTAGIVEYLSQTNGNLDFFNDDKGFKFIDDASFLEFFNLVSVGLTTYNNLQQIPSDISINSFYLPTENTFSQGCLNKISEGTAHNHVKLNSEKTKYMLINYYHGCKIQC